MFTNSFQEYYNELNKKVDEELQFQESQQKTLHEKIAETEKKIALTEKKVYKYNLKPYLAKRRGRAYR